MENDKELDRLFKEFVPDKYQKEVDEECEELLQEEEELEEYQYFWRKGLDK